MTIDHKEIKPESARHWLRNYWDPSTGERLRFYSAGATKFGVSLDKYHLIQRGVTLPVEKDVHHGYYRELMKDLSAKTLESLILSREAADENLDPGEIEVPRTLFDRLTGIFTAG